MKLTSLLKHFILELPQVSDSRNNELVGYAERNETYLFSEALHTGAPTGE
jgi:hypothetical protein